MSSIDERIVEMKFNNSQFEQGVKETSSLLDRLKEALKFGDSKKGLDDIQRAADGFSMDGMASDVENISDKFSALGAIGFAAIQKLTHAAMDWGRNKIGQVMDPILEGGRTRALNLEQAEFQFEGLGMDVEKSMDAALGAVKGTAFGLDEAAVLAANFGATGMEAGQEMEDALRGVSGVAAMAGASYSDIGNIFGKVAGQGRLMGNDLNRLAARGVNAAATLADQMGITETEVRDMVSKGQISFQDFADSMNEAFGEHATKANETYSGSLANMRAALSRIGAEFQSSKLEKHRRMFNAMTPVIDDVADALQPVADLYGELAESSAENFENFMESIDLTALIDSMPVFVDGIRNVLEAMDAITGPIGEAFKEVFSFEGDSVWLQNFAAAFERFTYRLIISEEAGQRIKTVFTGIFTAIRTAGSVLFNVGRLIGSTLGSIISLGAQLISAVVSPIGTLIGSLFDLEISTGNVNFSFTEFVDRVIELKDKGVEPLSDAIGWLADALASITEGGFSGVMANLREHAAPLAAVIDFITDAFKRFTGMIAGTDVDGGSILDSILDSANSVLDAIKSIWQTLQPAFSAIGGFLSDTVNALTGMFEKLDLSTVLQVLNTGLFAALIIGFQKFIRNGGGIFRSFDNLIRDVSLTLNRLTEATKRRDTLGDTLVKIGLAIGLFAGSMLLLAIAMERTRDLDWDELARGLAGLAGAMATMVISATALSALSGPMVRLSFGLILLSAAVVILASAMRIISRMDLNQLAHSLIGLAGAMGLLVGAAVVLSKHSGNLAMTAVGLLLFSVAIATLAGAMALMSLLSWDQIAKGLTAVGGILATLTTTLAVLSKNTVGVAAAAASIAVMAGALSVLVGVVAALGLLPIGVIEQGMGTLTKILAALTIATMVLGRQAPQTMGAAAAIAAMALALNMLVIPILALGNMNYDTLQQGLLSAAAAIGILVIAANLMRTASAGAGATVLMAGALVILAQAVKTFGEMERGDVVQGIMGIAGAMIAIGIAGKLLTGALPGILGLAAGIALVSVAAMTFALALAIFGPAAVVAAAGIKTLALAAADLVPAILPLMGLGAALIVFGLGAAIAAVGIIALAAGLMLMGVGLALIAVSALTGATALAYLANAIVELLPMAWQLLAMSAVIAVLGVGLALAGAGALIFGLGLLVVGAAILVAAAGLYVLAQALTMVHEAGEPAIETMINFLMRMIDLIPEVMAAIAEGFIRMMEIVDENSQVIISAIESILVGIMEVAIDLVPLILELLNDILIGLLETIDELGPEIIDLLVNLLLELLAAIDEIVPEILAAAGRLIMSLLQAIEEWAPEILSTLEFLIHQMLDTIVAMVPEFVIAALELIEGVLNGLEEGLPDLITAGADMVIAVLEGIEEEIPRIMEAAADLVITFVDEAANTVETVIPEIMSSMERIGTAIIDGAIDGIMGGLGKIGDAAKEMASSAWEATKDFFTIGSPSRLYMDAGKWLDEGLAIGIRDNADIVGKSSEEMGQEAVDGLSKSISGIDHLLDADMDLNPTITPVLDLSDIEKRADDIGDLLGGQSLSGNAYGRTSALSMERRESARALRELEAQANRQATEAPKLEFKQYNTSPQALSTSEIYRRTRNQISLAREALDA